MLILNGEIEFTDNQGQGITVRNPSEIQIDSTYQNMTDTCTITMPSKFYIRNRLVDAFKSPAQTISQGENRLFRLGDQVDVRLSYVGQHKDELQDDNALVFQGFIREINNDSPLKIICDDYMYLLKKSRANISIKKDATIKEIVDKLLTKAGWNDVGDGFYGINLPNGYHAIEVKYTDPNMTYGKLLVTGKPSIASVLDKLKSFKFFFKGRTLWVTLPQTSSLPDREEHKLDYERQIIEDDLFYKTDEDVLFRVLARSFVNNNEYREVNVGPEEGELRTFYAPSGLNEKDLKLFAEEELNKLRFTGFKASFITFGDPIIRHLDTVEIVREKFPEQGVGRFIVDRVVTEFGFGGFRQEVYLGSKA